MKIGVLVLNFGEPANPVMEEVVPFLERIFQTNAGLNGSSSDEERRRRSRELAERRAPGLIEEYEQIGGSPLNDQARQQSEALEAELRRRGYDASAYSGMQFTEPSIRSAVEAARGDGVQQILGLPVYPLCGPSTTVAALQVVSDAIREMAWDVDISEVTGWHRHPDYTALRVDAIRTAAEDAGLDLSHPRTRLVFSAHGTPLRYLREGSRYDVYVKDHCDRVAAALGVEAITGFQNHSNRPIEWTQPDIEKVIASIDADRVLVDPVSFMHEQSETLSELDVELREEAEERGIAFHRVPIPHDDPRFVSVLADLVETRLGLDNPAALEFHQCLCRPHPAARCLNAPMHGAG